MKRPFKKLDDVIKAMDFCINDGDTPNCLGCPYADEDVEAACCGNDREDALHYLKEYRQTREDLLDGMKRLEEKEMMFIHTMADLENNLPLSWDELRQMEGKPVWIDSVPLVRRWVIIKKFHPIGGNKNLFDMEVEDGGHFLRKNMRRDDPAWWQAYRKERKNETD